MKDYAYISFFIIGLFLQNVTGQVAAKKQLILMGCAFELTAVGDNDEVAWAAVEAGISEIKRIETMISSWDAASQTSEVNRQSGIKHVKVDRELYDLIYRAKKLSALTDGAFDISFASMDRIWTFDGAEKDLAAAEVVSQARSKINWQNVELNHADTSVFLKDKGMKIGFGGIGKGYAANKAKLVMKEMDGISGGLINASGDLLSWGQCDKEDGWQIQIADPEHTEQTLGWLSIADLAIVTSGDYEKYFTHHGKRYAHIINPITGYPTTGIKSVTVICPDAEVADALATSVFVLGKDKGLQLINRLKHIEALVITDDNTLHTSHHLQLNQY